MQCGPSISQRRKQLRKHQLYLETIRKTFTRARCNLDVYLTPLFEAHAEGLRDQQ